MGKPFWTSGELAERGNVTDAFIRQEIKGGRLRAEKFGHVWMISDEEAQRWLSRETGRKRRNPGREQ